MLFFRVLVLFLLISPIAKSDLLAQTSAQVKKIHKATDTVGVINNFVITLRDFRGQLKATMKEHISEIKDQKVSDTAYTRFVNLAWDKMVSDILIDLEIKKKNWNVTNTEAIKRLLEKPSPELEQSFTDSAGVYHKDALKVFLENPAQDSLRDKVVAYYATMFEQTDFFKKLAPRATTEAERKRAFEQWMNRQVAAAQIDDRRTAFGFY